MSRKGGILPDMTLCSNGGKCPSKLSCFRFLAIPDKWQSYSDFYSEGKNCEHFLVLQKGDKVNKPRLTKKQLDSLIKTVKDSMTPDCYLCGGLMVPRYEKPKKGQKNFYYCLECEEK